MKYRGFHMTITTGLDDARDLTVLGGVSLEHDLRLIKAALLYADDVTLYSPAASMLLSIGNLDTYHTKEQIDLLTASLYDAGRERGGPPAPGLGNVQAT